MSRPSRHEILMRQAQVVAERSTCSRAHVGVVIAHEGRVVSQGYNGAPVGMPHCDHACNCSWEDDMNAEDISKIPPRYHDKWCSMKSPCTVAVHAEANAVAFAARYGIATAGAILYTTVAPCLPCAQLVINAGIMVVCYRVAYRDNAGLDLLGSAGIDVWDYATNEERL